MRIALLTPGFSAAETDWCIPALLNLARGLAQAHDVHVFALRYPYRQATYEVYGACVHALGGGLTRRWGRVPLWARALTALRRTAAAAPFDVVHACWVDEPAFLATLAGRWLGTPVVASLMGGELARLPAIGYGGRLNRLNDGLTRWSLRRVQHVTAGSRWLAQLAVDSGYVRQPPHWAPLGVDTALFRPNPSPPPAAAQLLSVASLTPVKDHATLLHALALLPDCRLTVAGDGPLRPTLQALAADLGLAGRVVWRGAVTHEQLPALYAAADVHVLASQHESQSLAVLEAAACGVLSVGMAVGILPELIPAAGLAAPGDVAGLARAIRWGVTDSAERRAARQAIHARARQEFSLAAAQARWLAIYQAARQSLLPD